MPTLPEVKARADWDAVEQLYRQSSTLLNDPAQRPDLPEIIAGPLALRMGRVFASYGGAEMLFVDDLLTVMSHVDRLQGPPERDFNRLYFDERYQALPAYNPAHGERRRPRPFEAAVETCRRLRDFIELRYQVAYNGLTTAGILGGSASYGRFYNVCGTGPATAGSDLDVLIITPCSSDAAHLQYALQATPGISSDSVEYFRQRIEVYERLVNEYTDILFSQKIPIWTKHNDPHLATSDLNTGYNISLHVAHRDLFDRIILKDLPAIPHEFTRTLYDYRDTEPRPEYSRRSFSGSDLHAVQHTENETLGYLSTALISECRDKRLDPGLHQNLIIPQFELRWDDAALAIDLPIISFKWKVLERLRMERSERPYEVQRLSLAHTRYSNFAPHVRNRIDNLTIEA